MDFGRDEMETKKRERWMAKLEDTSNQLGKFLGEDN